WGLSVLMVILTLRGIKATSSESKPQLINHGLINVKGTFNAEADQVVNQMKAFNQNALASVFKNPAKNHDVLSTTYSLYLDTIIGVMHRVNLTI
ncbi:PfhB2, partial [Pasteurella multocida subsp. gallicida str. Anand1_poultry]